MSIECDFEGEYPEFCNSSKVKGRKEHRCCDCNGVIRKGESHTCVTGKWDGEVKTYRICADCQSIRCATGCDSIPLGLLSDAIAESGDKKLQAMFKTTKAERQKGTK